MSKIMELPFIKGLDLCEQFFTEAIRPLLHHHFPTLRYAAGRLGGGSDVLGFDTPQSRDHDWGPRATLFLAEADFAELAPAIDELLKNELPLTFHGYPTHYGRHEDDTLNLTYTDAPPINHAIQITTAARFAHSYLALDIVQPMQPVDWLCLPSQMLATVRNGRLFHDSLGQISQLRQTLHFYPHDLWLYLLAGQWTRIAQEDVFVSRTGDVGDDLGSRILAARQVQNIMRLAFLLEKQYAPYPKWFGTAFARLACASNLQPLFAKVWQAETWQAREAALNEAYLYVARWHNELQLTEPLPAEVGFFHERPYRVIHTDQYADALSCQIQDPQVRALPPGLGNLDQLTDNTDILSNPNRFRHFASLFKEGNLQTNS
ncbi:MAG: DUF4037 domain-containing protein [Anaerolineales bacterium]|nr:DUF4037 domain-containing protein [Anaerolineales bacterium]MCB8937100.1 DUF4037 domain-containing protein [Ardenticatenaceae bacterium]